MKQKKERSDASFIFLEGGQVVGVGSGQLGLHLCLPSDEFLFEFSGFLGIFLGQVVFFKRIVDQVVEFNFFIVIEFDQLPFPISNGSSGFPSRSVIVRVVPVKRSWLSFFPSQFGKQASSVGMQLGLERKAGKLEHGGEEIHGHDRIVTNASLLGHSRGPDDGGFAYPAFVEPALSGSQWLVATGP